MLRSLRFEPGDEILVPDHAYQACRNTIDYVADRWGATVVTVNLPFPIDGPEVVMERIMAGVTDRTVLAMIDTVTSPTGLRMPFEALVEALESRGVAVLLDAAHGIGMVPLALDDLGASYTTTNAHKWLSAPKGSAVLHVRKDRQADVHPLTISHGMTFPLGDTTRFRHEFDWTGTRDPSAWCALPFTVEHVGGMMEGGWPAIMARNDALCLEARQLLCDRLVLRCPARQRCCPASRPCASPRPRSKLRRACSTRCTTVWPSAVFEFPFGRGRLLPGVTSASAPTCTIPSNSTTISRTSSKRNSLRSGPITSGAARLHAQCASRVRDLRRLVGSASPHGLVQLR